MTKVWALLGFMKALFTPLVSITALDHYGQASRKVYLLEKAGDTAATVVGRGLGSWKAGAGRIPAVCLLPSHLSEPQFPFFSGETGESQFLRMLVLRDGGGNTGSKSRRGFMGLF